MKKKCIYCQHITASEYVNYCGACGVTFRPKDICAKCGDTIDYNIQRSCYVNDEDNAICEKCWHSGK